MSKAKMEAASELIKEMRYDEARVLLRTVDHPTARKWLEQLDGIAPAKTPVLQSAAQPRGPGITLKVVCPWCSAQSPFAFSNDRANYSIRCPACEKVFVGNLYLVRAKRSQGNKSRHRRHFSVRVKGADDGRERVIEFDRPGYDDFELRSKDLALFTYLDGKLAIVQNFSVGQYMTISRPPVALKMSWPLVAILLFLIAGVIFWCVALTMPPNLQAAQPTATQTPAFLSARGAGVPAATWTPEISSTAVATDLPDPGQNYAPIEVTDVPTDVPTVSSFSGAGGTLCGDGSYSSSTGRGTCSHHQGIAGGKKKR